MPEDNEACCIFWGILMLIAAAVFSGFLALVLMWVGAG